MRVVLDVNILVSASLSDASPPGLALKACSESDVTCFVIPAMIDRLGEILTEEPYFAKRMSPDDAEIFVGKVLRKANSDIKPDESVQGIAPDDEDDLVLGTAVAAQADFLVTGDRGVLAIGSYRGVAIVTAREFLAILEGMEP